MMTHEFFSPKDLKKLPEFKELKNHLKQVSGSSEHVLTAAWRFIKHMQSELNLPPQTPMRELIRLFNAFQEIRKAFDLHTNNFSQLNELYVEIITVREMLDLPKDLSVTEILSRITPELVPSLGVGRNSLLERLLQFYVLK